MSIDPRYLPTDDAAAYAVPAPPLPDDPHAPPAVTPHIGHAALFGLLVLLAAVLIGIAFAVSLKHIKPYVHETNEQMQTDPRIVIPVEAVMYAVAAGASLLVFPLLWRRSFAQGVHWRAAVVERRWWLLAGIGVVTSVVVQLLSNFLPIPKELPIDKFFTNRIGVWLVAIFGVTVAPAFEELAFRGFLLPSLASAWDWVVQRGARTRLQAAGAPSAWQTAPAAYSPLRTDEDSGLHPPAPEAAAESIGVEAANLTVPAFDAVSVASGDVPDPRWSIPALIFSTVVTSIGFALLHGGQLAHSLAPLGVLFAVSLVLCLTRLRFHSLAASTLVHSLYNATIFVMLFVGTDGFRHLEKLSK